MSDQQPKQDESAQIDSNVGLGSVTMDTLYADGSSHDGCPVCGFCKTCGDCEQHGCGCKYKKVMPNAKLSGGMNNNNTLARVISPALGSGATCFVPDNIGR